MHRRDVLKAATATATAAVVGGPALFRGAWAAGSQVPGDGPYGPPAVDTGHGFLVPDGFSARVVAAGGEPVAATGYVWHPDSDGAGTFATPDGGWILVSNSESPPATGGASAIRFGPPGPDGVAPIEDAYRVLGRDVGTTSAGNCAGGVTPWGTWLSCEENAGAQHVWECDPTGRTPAIELPQLGTFAHEAAAVDPESGTVYLTEDREDCRLFRWVPDEAPRPGRRPDFDRGRLQVAGFGDPPGSTRAGSATWIDVDASDPSTYRADGSTRFVRGEGAWFHDGFVYWVATTNSEVYAYDTRTDRQVLLHDDRVEGSPMRYVDNICVHPETMDLYVAEDGTDRIEVGVITAPDRDGRRQVAPFVRALPGEHDDSEFAGPVFDPSGTRLYLASQRRGDGVVYEISGPFLPEPEPTTSAGAPATDAASTTTARAAERAVDPGSDVETAPPTWLAGLGIGAVGAAGWAARRRRQVAADRAGDQTASR
jgi:secreted PhoX family phosphatase